jgi:hypothetical protein
LGPVHRRLRGEDTRRTRPCIQCDRELPGLNTPGIKDWIAKFQVTAEAWYVANPDLTVAETKKLARVGKALDEFLDKIG